MKYRHALVVFLMSSAAYAMEKNEEHKSAWTQKYHKTSQMQFQFAQDQLPNMHLQDDDAVLDVGCGTGRTTHLFAQHLPKGSIVGIDSSQNMIELAQEEYGVEQNITFKVADAAQLSFDNTFDRVILFFCLQWLKEKQKAMDGIARALKSGGHAHIFVPVAAKDYTRGLNCIRAVLEKHPQWTPFCSLPNAEHAHAWIERAQKSDLKVVSQQTIEKKTTYASRKEWDTYCLGLGITTLPETENQQFITEVNDLLYQKHGLTENDPYVRTTNILALELVKKQLSKRP